MTKITNNSPHPYPVIDADGTRHKIAPGGSVDIELTDRAEAMYRTASFLTVGGEKKRRGRPRKSG